MKRRAGLLNLPDGVRQKMISYVGPKCLVPLQIVMGNHRLLCFRAPEGGDLRVYRQFHENESWATTSTFYVSEAVTIPFLLHEITSDQEEDTHFRYQGNAHFQYHRPGLEWCFFNQRYETSHEAEIELEKLLRQSTGPLTFLGQLRVDRAPEMPRASDN